MTDDEKNIGKLHGSWFTHQTIRFPIFVGHINNCGYICNSFFKVGMMISSLGTICPKKGHRFQLPLPNLLLLYQSSNEIMPIMDTQY